MSELETQIDRLLDRARETLEKIATKADEDDLGPVLSLLDDLEDVADEAEDILSSADLTQLARAIDWSDLPDAIELEELPEAVRDRDLSEVLVLRKLLELSELHKLWEGMDTRELWREKREFDDEMDDITEDEDDASDSMREASIPAGEVHEIDPESIENAIQSELTESVGEFREKLLEARERLRDLRARTEDRFPDRRRNRSRNPTAVTTMPQRGVTSGGVANHSTVPVETRHSTAPNRPRIYGSRFESAGGADDG